MKKMRKTKMPWWLWLGLAVLVVGFALWGYNSYQDNNDLSLLPTRLVVDPDFLDIGDPYWVDPGSAIQIDTKCGPVIVVNDSQKDVDAGLWYWLIDAYCSDKPFLRSLYIYHTPSLSVVADNKSSTGWSGSTNFPDQLNYYVGVTRVKNGIVTVGIASAFFDSSVQPVLQTPDIHGKLHTMSPIEAETVTGIHEVLGHAIERAQEDIPITYGDPRLEEEEKTAVVFQFVALESLRKVDRFLVREVAH
ncbi:hypothetical protein JW887_02550 [Candidatus Dojkabacteria bacterium]|nr:hypothetical protein [Candidatus Dojkabacteria bacterium]